jgi:hypothetical protein
MKILWAFIHLTIIALSLPKIALGQSSSYDEYILRYNYKEQKFADPKTKIPFDHNFMIIVDGLDAKNLWKAHAYKVKWVGGQRLKSVTIFKDLSNGKLDTAAIVDMDLEFVPNSKPLRLKIKALLPEVDFDIELIYHLLEPSRALLYKVNQLIYEKELGKAEDAYKDFKSSLRDTLSEVSYGLLKWQSYKKLFDSRIAPIYQKGELDAQRNYSARISEEQIKAIAAASSKDNPAIGDLSNLLTVVRNNNIDPFLDGRLNITKINSGAKLIGISNFKSRKENLDSNMNYIKRLMANLEKISLYQNPTAPSSNTLLLSSARANLKAILELGLSKNRNDVDSIDTKIGEMTDNIDSLKSNRYISGKNGAVDLKSAGANILFLDAGFTNILARGLDRKTTYIPRLYLGVSIYFRSIDKNTRTSDIAKKKDLEGLHRDMWYNDQIKEYQYGPDYEIAARRNIWQHLSLSLGLTLGNIPNSNFENFYNGMSLLIGPAYRFKRAFKVSAGTALLKRSSFNPLISEKKVTAGFYGSLSVDIDFIESIKDLKNMVFK